MSTAQEIKAVAHRNGTRALVIVPSHPSSPGIVIIVFALKPSPELRFQLERLRPAGVQFRIAGECDLEEEVRRLQNVAEQAGQMKALRSVPPTPRIRDQIKARILWAWGRT